MVGAWGDAGAEGRDLDEGGMGGRDAGFNFGRAVDVWGVDVVRAVPSAFRAFFTTGRFRRAGRTVAVGDEVALGLKARGKGEVGLSMIRSVANFLLCQHQRNDSEPWLRIVMRMGEAVFHLHSLV